ncbi:hypothetical protein CFP65_7268 [Kitasatospora sp. MMS16-BH015]|uniref:hypothetical protein n=1 Tax=Kitasatospora sp. MMS16-BH015 TaxID=2018025 RepID=UPI000CA167C6|nr:hypothetical protein [Kitasatospora sp. MMS16-BH015]AUG81855.1 hypothetical protein CFP65_7268 [Kitasatospora sp. MMS16-BH015]
MTPNSSTDYFTELAERLRAAGRPEQEVTATVADLANYLLESGSPDAQEEFGTPADFAERLTGGHTVEEPGAGVETWKWATDIYADRRHLNHYGDQGWEVEGLDRLGRFVCRRTPGAAMRWEYRRETADNAKEREATAAGLAPDGWEACGHWMYFMYFKRPKAAMSGPAAELDELTARPDKQLFLSRTYRDKLKPLLVVAVISGTMSALVIHYGGPDRIAPILIGAAVAGPIGAVTGWYRMKRDVTAGREES